MFRLQNEFESLVMEEDRCHSVLLRLTYADVSGGLCQGHLKPRWVPYATRLLEDVCSASLRSF